MRLFSLNPNAKEENDRAVNARLCSVCGAGHLRQHPQHEEREFRTWLKCTICGFSRRDPRYEEPSSDPDRS